MDPLLLAIAEASDLGFCVLDASGRVRFFSRRCARLTGADPARIESAEDLLSISYLEEEEGELEQEIGTELAARVRGLEPGPRALFDPALPARYDAWVRPAGAELRRLEVRRRGLEDGGTLWVLRDTTEQAAIESAYRAKQRELDRARFDLTRSQAHLIQSEKLATVGQLAAGIAHELNTPLNTVLGYAQLLARQLGDGELREEVDAIEKAARRCRKTVRDMLSFTRKAKGEPEPIDLHETILGVLSLLRHDLDSRGVEVRLKLDPGKPRVVIDSNRLEQLFVILAQNAAQAMPEGGLLSLATRVYGEPEPRVEVLVRDTGTGIAAEHLPHIFEPFFTTKEPGQGTGLGLYIAYQITAQVDGEIQVWSRPDVGTEFRVRLPLPSEPDHDGEDHELHG